LSDAHLDQSTTLACRTIAEKNTQKPFMKTKHLALRIFSGVLTAYLALNFVACSEDEAKKIAVVETGEISALSKNSATISGEVTNDGFATVTDRGVVWSINAEPTTADNKESDGTGEGEFEAEITGLTPNTLYHARAFAVNSVGTSYGEEITFTTNDLAQITTGSISNLTTTGVTVEGNVTFDGNTTVTGRGIVLATTPNPTIADIMKPEGSGTGTFSTSISGLTPNTTYYARAFANNSQGTAYGLEVEFTTYLNPALTTGSASNVTSVTASLGGEITSVGSPAITEKGIVYGTDHNPTTNNIKVTISNGTSGVFSVDVTQADPSTTYYARAYTISELGTFYGSEVSFTTSDINASLKARFNLDSPDSYKDATGNNADLVGGSNTAFAPNRNNEAGKAMYQDGTANALVNGSVNFGNSTAITVSLWFKPINNGIYIIGSTPFMYYYMNISGNVQAHLYVNNGSGYAGQGMVPASSFIDKWHHFAGVYDGTTVKYYLDGVLAGSGNYSSGATFGTMNFYLGSTLGNASNFYEGLMDDIKMYGRALSAEEVKYVYNH
jgi:hypothetical protein